MTVPSRAASFVAFGRSLPVEGAEHASCRDLPGQLIDPFRDIRSSEAMVTRPEPRFESWAKAAGTPGTERPTVLTWCHTWLPGVVDLRRRVSLAP